MEKWILEKEFNIAIGHRLSKNENLCKFIHGHNIRVLVGIEAEKLTDDEMVMDFSAVKKMINTILDKYDHATILNSKDVDLIRDLKKHDMRLVVVNGDPTSEYLCKHFYGYFKTLLSCTKPFNNKMSYVTIYETPTSKMTYRQ